MAFHEVLPLLKMPKQKLIGPFSQILNFSGLPQAGPLIDRQLQVQSQAGVLLEGEKIIGLGKFEELRKTPNIDIEEIAFPAVLLPGFIDVHTHLCWAGSRAKDYSLRVAGKTYQEILKQGGGILDTVRKTRAATLYELSTLMRLRCDRQLQNGITTCEVKSGYGLTVEDEIKMLQVIGSMNETHALDLVPSCLAAHVKPLEYSLPDEYLEHVLTTLLPQVKALSLSSRVDIFVEPDAFPVELARDYLLAAKSLGFDVVVHADQFTPGGAKLAAEVGALSADHLEASKEEDMQALACSDVAAVVLPGASLGLGMPFAPARRLLDNGCALVIASDWNPGSAPMGDLLTQAAVLGVAQKLTLAETFAALTCRAATALKLSDRGKLDAGFLADLIAFPCEDYREILYHQGQMKPVSVWKRGEKVLGAK